MGIWFIISTEKEPDKLRGKWAEYENESAPFYAFIYLTGQQMHYLIINQKLSRHYGLMKQHMFGAYNHCASLTTDSIIFLKALN